MRQVRVHRRFYRLLFTGIMALMMSLIISAALLLIKAGFTPNFAAALLHSWALAFPVAWPCAYGCAYIVQEHLFAWIEFYS